MKQQIYCIIISLIVVIVIFFHWIIKTLNNKMIFHPHKVSMNAFVALIDSHKNNSEKIVFKSKNDNIKLTGVLVNSRRKPSWTDTIILYSHGNASWVGSSIKCMTIDMLSKYGSVLLYDYRGYGASDGTPSEIGLYNDIHGAWNFLTNIKKIPANKIIIFGHSLGASVSSHLVSTLVKKHPSNMHPKALILEAPFSTIKDMANYIAPSISSLLIYKFNNLYNVKNIKNMIPVCILHSRMDETIPFEQSLKIKKHTTCKMIEINGGHCNPIYSDELFKFFDSLSE